MRKVRYDIFISYRWDGGAELARLVEKTLLDRGYRPFLDKQSLRTGYFDEALLKAIAEASDFVLILSPNALERCGEPNDFVRREIEHALRCGKNIVPMMMKGFRFPDRSTLPEELRELPRHNAFEYSHDRSNESLVRLCSMLTASPGWTARARRSAVGAGLVLAALLLAGAAWYGLFGLTRDTTALRKQGDIIEQKAAEIHTGVKVVVDKTTVISEKVDRVFEAVGRPTELVNPPVHKFDFLRNASVYRKRRDYANARSSYQQFFERDMADLYDTYQGYWELLEQEFTGEEKVRRLFTQLVEQQPQSRAAPLVLLANDKDRDVKVRLRQFLQASPDYLPAYGLLHERLPNDTIAEMQQRAELREEFRRRGGHDKAKDFFLNDKDDPLLVMLKKLDAEMAPDVMTKVDVHFENDAYIQLMYVGLDEKLVPRELLMKFPSGVVVRVPFGPGNPMGADEPIVAFAIEPGAAVRFEKRSPSDRRIFRQCGTLFGIGSTPVEVELAYIDGKGNAFTFPRKVSLYAPAFALEVRNGGDGLFRGPYGPVLQIKPAVFLNSCEIALKQEGPYVLVPNHMNVPTLREIPLKLIPDLPLQAGRYQVWVRGKEFEKGTRVGPEHLTLIVPDNLEGLTGGVGAVSKAPFSKEDLEIKAPALTALAYSPDGSILASVGHDRAVRLWNASSGGLLGKLDHDYTPTCIAFAPDSKTLATSSGREQARDRGVPITLWDLETKTIRHALQVKESAVTVLAFSPDGTKLAAGNGRFGLPLPITLWDLNRKLEIARMKASDYRFRATCLAFSPDGTKLAAGCQDRHEVVYLFDLASQKQCDRLAGHKDGIDALTFSPDGKLLLVGSSAAGTTVKLWELASGENRAAAIQFTARHHVVAFGENSRPLVVDVLDDRAKVWDVATGKELLWLAPLGAITTVAFHPSGRALATGGSTIKIWKLDD